MSKRYMFPNFSDVAQEVVMINVCWIYLPKIPIIEVLRLVSNPGLAFSRQIC